MKHIHSTNLHQRGATLLEALVALLLTSIIALGGALSIGKILKTQRQSNIQQTAVDQLRVLLQSGSDLCGTTPQITVNNITLNVTVTCTQQNITVGQNSISMQKPVLSVTDDSLGGEVRVGESS